MNRFDWKSFKKGENNIIVNCKTEADTIDFLTEADKNGLKWFKEGDLLSTGNCWHYYKEDTCYRVTTGNILKYGDLKIYNPERIVEWVPMMTMDEFSWDLFEKGLIRVQCDTEENSDSFLHLSRDHGLKFWSSGRELLSKSTYNFDRDKTYYRYDCGMLRGNINNVLLKSSTNNGEKIYDLLWDKNTIEEKVNEILGKDKPEEYSLYELEEEVHYSVVGGSTHLIYKRCGDSMYVMDKSEPENGFSPTLNSMFLLSEWKYTPSNDPIESKEGWWSPEKSSNKYSYINTAGKIETTTWLGYKEDQERFENANCFDILEKALEVSGENTLYRKMKRFADTKDTGVINWGCNSESKYYIYYDQRSKKFRISSFYAYLIPGVVYFSNQSTAQQCLDEIVNPPLK